MKQFLISDDLIQVEKIQILDFLPLFENFDFNQDGFMDFDDFFLFTCSQDDMVLRCQYEEFKLDQI